MKHRIAIIAVIALSVVISCKDYKSGVFTGWRSHGTETSARATYDGFDGRIVKTRAFKANTTVVFDYDFVARKGALRLMIVSPGEEMKTLITVSGGSGRGEVPYGVTRDGDHTIIISGHETSGKFSVSWKTRE